jgi:predicted transcriptional regulator
VVFSGWGFSYFSTPGASTVADEPPKRLSERSRANMCTFAASRHDIMSTTITIRLEDEVKARLDRLAESTERSKSFLAAEAIREFVENNEWQIGEVRAALREADAGDFASDEDVEALARKWNVNAA